MSNGLIQGKLLCVELNCEKWFLDCLEQLYGMRELGHSDASIYLLEDVKAALVAHSADGRPTKAEMLKRIKTKGVADEVD
jgi:hypothetical protein